MIDISSISENVISVIRDTFPYITLPASELLKKAGGSIKEESLELLEKIKNKFGLKRDFVNVLNDIEENPNNEKYANKLKEILVEALKTDENFRNEIQTYLEKEANKKVESKVNGNYNIVFTAGKNISKVNTNKEKSE